jgi:hypothetical protein
LEDLKARINARIAGLEKEKTDMLAAVQRELVGYNTAIAELRKLVEPAAPEPPAPEPPKGPVELAAPEASQGQGDDAGQLPEAKAVEQPSQA